MGWWRNLFGSGDAGARVDRAPEPPLDPVIEALHLSETARRAAYLLKARHPEIVFTSGRRDRAAQARAMAANVALNRKWIRQTYRANRVSRACQGWVDTHPEATTPKAIAAGLHEVLEQMWPEELARFSRHLSGDAFDVLPVEQGAKAVKACIRALPGLRKFIEKEGGFVRWHVQF